MVAPLQPRKKSGGGFNAGLIFLRARSSRCEDAVEDHDLLPDFPRYAVREIFNLIHRREGHRVIEVLNIQGGDLAQERQEVAAMIKIADEFRRILRTPPRRRACPPCVPDPW